MTLSARLAEFRSCYERAELAHRGDVWRYWRGTVTGTPVLWLTGALGAGEMAFPQALHLRNDFRIILPDYPAVPKLYRVVDGLAALLDAEAVNRVYVVGGSFGGMLAQHFVRKFPGRVGALVLSHATVPDPSYTRAALMRLTSLLVPEHAYRSLFRRRLRPSFLKADPFWVDYFDTMVAALKKRDLASRVALAREFLQTRLSPLERKDSPARVLIIGGDDDPLMPPGSLAALTGLYPSASVHTFDRTGHSAAIRVAEAYAEVIRDFLTGGAA